MRKLITKKLELIKSFLITTSKDIFLRLLVIFFSIKDYKWTSEAALGYKNLKKIRESNLPFNVKFIMIKNSKYQNILHYRNGLLSKTSEFFTTETFGRILDRMKEINLFIDKQRNTPYFNRRTDSENQFIPRTEFKNPTIIGLYHQAINEFHKEKINDDTINEAKADSKQLTILTN